MKRFGTVALLLALAFQSNAFAHKIWLRPSQTVFSGNEPLVTVDAAVSNDLFYFNHFPLQLDGLNIIAPDGNVVEAQSKSVLRYRSVFDLPLTQAGTYRIAVINHGLFASWEADGKPQRWRGKADQLKAAIPAEATNVKVTESYGRVETFVTNGAPTTTALEATGKGIELMPITHFNDLYAGEAAQFRLLVDGKPASDLKIAIIRGETRYRNQQDEMEVTTNANGEFSVTWPEPGMYWMETSADGGVREIPEATSKRMSYVATLEVLPQ